jgi:hypothetical protein
MVQVLEGGNGWFIPLPTVWLKLSRRARGVSGVGRRVGNDLDASISAEFGPNRGSRPPHNVTVVQVRNRHQQATNCVLENIPCT